MTDVAENTKPTASEKDNGTEDNAKVQLPTSYFQELLDLPACKSRGCCDDCGKCER